jgi:hypothetical protein
VGIRFTFILNNRNFDTISLVQNLCAYPFYMPNMQAVRVKDAYSFQITQPFQNAAIN